MASNKRKKPKIIKAEKSPSGTKPADSAPVSEPHPRRIRLFRLISSIVVPLMCFSLLEIGLRPGGYGYRPNFYIESDATALKEARRALQALL